MKAKNNKPDKLEDFQRQMSGYKEVFRDWTNRTKEISKRYRDERKDKTETRKINLFHSNVEILKAATYARTPKVAVARRWKTKDKLVRNTSLIIERVGQYSLDTSNYDAVMRQCNLDALLFARGTPWHGFRKKTALINGVEQIIQEEPVIEYVHSSDFGHTDARFWSEVEGVWRRLYLSKDEIPEEWDQKLLKNVSFNFVPRAFVQDEEAYKGAEVTDSFGKAKIIEYWCKNSGKQYFFAEDGSDFLFYDDDPLHLTGFFPTPKPLYGLITNESLVPIPDFCIAQDQYFMLDDVVDRIAGLTQQLRVAGYYDASIVGLKNLLETKGDTLIPVKGWAQFTQSGGIKGSIDYVPIAEVAATLIQLYGAKDRLTQDVNEIYGIPDIVRGVSNPNETATAQQAKREFATIRMQDRQDRMQQFASENAKIMTELAIEHCSPETIWYMAGCDTMELIFDELPPQATPEMVQQAQQMGFEACYKLMSDDKLRGFRVDIETDSMLYADEQAEKQTRTELLTAVGNTINQIAPALEVMPSLSSMVGELILYAVRGFNGGRQLEETIERASEQMIKEQEAQQAAQAEKQGEPSEEEIAAQKQAQQEEEAKQAELLRMNKEYQDSQAAALKEANRDKELQLKEREVIIQERKQDLEEKKHNFDELERKDKMFLQAMAAAGEDEDEMQAKEKKEKEPKEVSASPINVSVHMPKGGGKKRARTSVDPVTGQKIYEMEDVLDEQA